LGCEGGGNCSDRNEGNCAVLVENDWVDLNVGNCVD